MPDASVPDTTPPMGIHKKLCTGALEQGIRIRTINIYKFSIVGSVRPKENYLSFLFNI